MLNSIQFRLWAIALTMAVGAIALLTHGMGWLLLMMIIGAIISYLLVGWLIIRGNKK